MCHPNRRDQSIVLYGQLASFSYCLLQRILPKVYSKNERDWEAFREFDFTGKTQLGLLDFMRKNVFQNSALRVAKVTMDMEEKNSKKESGAHAVTSIVVDETLYLFRVGS